LSFLVTFVALQQMRTVLFTVEGSVIENVTLQAPTTSETKVLERSGKLVTSLLAG